MKYLTTAAFVALICALSCGRKAYSTNGETIYRTGRNLQGQSLLDRHGSRITIVRSCQGCHGPNGNRIKGVSLRYAGLTTAQGGTVPYTDSLFFRFLDHDLKSNGARANIGVLWKMSEADKRDLWAFLQTL